MKRRLHRLLVWLDARANHRHDWLCTLVERTCEERDVFRCRHAS